MKSNAVTTCRYWLQGKLYPNTERDDFLSLLMGTYKLSAQEARVCLSDAEYAEQAHDQKVAAHIAGIVTSIISN